MNIPMTQSDIAIILAESPHFREVAAKVLITPEPNDDKLNKLKGWVRGSFGPTTRIPAIKFVRNWAYDNGISELSSLAGAKKFVDELIPWERSA